MKNPNPPGCEAGGGLDNDGPAGADAPPATPARPKTSRWPKASMFRSGGTAPTGTVAGGMSGLHDWPFHINPH
jgi:hypothetical protein